MTQHVTTSATVPPTLVDAIERASLDLCRAVRDQDHLEAAGLAEWILSVRPEHALATTALESLVPTSGTFLIPNSDRPVTLTSELDDDDILEEQYVS